MSDRSTARDLYATLQSKQQHDRQQIEQLTRQELEKLATNLKNSLQHELNITVSAIASDLQKQREMLNASMRQSTQPLLLSLQQIKKEAQQLQALTAKAWLKPLLTSAAILLSVFAASWGLMQWLSSSIEQQLQTRAQLQQQIAQQQQTLAQLQQQTFGIELMSDSSGRYIVLPRQTVLESGYKVGNRDAYKLLKK